MLIVGPLVPQAIADQITDIDAKLIAGNVSIISPIGPGGSVELVVGDTYAVADGRGLVWTSTSWPDLTSASVAFVVSDAAANVILNAAATVNGTSVIVELTSDQTALLVVSASSGTGMYVYSLVATLSDNSVVTLVQGDATAIGRPGNSDIQGS